MTPSHSHLTDDRLTLLYFQEGSEAAQAPEREHLAQCPACQRQYAQLAHFLDALRDVPLPEHTAGWEQRLWTKLSPRVTPLVERRRRGRLMWVWLAAPALAALLVAAFLAGKYTARPAAQPLAFSSQARERVLLITLGDHLDRSQIVLAELVHAPPGQPADISEEQKLAVSLIGETRLLRQTATHSGDLNDAAVLDELERVFLEVSHSPAEVSPLQLDRLRERIEGEGLLFKVRVIGANAREKGMKL